MTEELATTPLHADHKALGGRLVPFAGYSMPVQYAGVVKEHQAVRNAVGLFDVSHMGELSVTGPGSLEAVNRLVTNDLARIVDGQAMYTCCCNPGGTILDDLIVYRRSATNLMVVCNASNRAKIVGHFKQELGESVELSDRSDEFALIAVQGPRALETLAAAGTDLDIAQELKSFRFSDTRVAGVPTTVARTGYTGEDGVEIFVPNEGASRLWNALLEAGREFGAQPAGLGARDTLRLEARLSLYGNDIDETTNPIEAGLGWTVKLGKADFIGKAALEAVKAAGPRRKLVGFVMAGRGIARHGYDLLAGPDQVVGQCTSGAPSPTLGSNIGLGYLPTEMTEIGTKFLVDCRGKAIDAEVVKPPFYKRARPS